MSEIPQPPELTGIEAEAAIAMEVKLKCARVSDWVTIMQRVREAMASRQAQGREHYGMTLKENPAAMTERLRHLWEEMLDSLGYSQWIWDGYICRVNEHEDAHTNQSVGLAAIDCMQGIIKALVELDRVMRKLGMEPVKKGGSDV